MSDVIPGPCSNSYPCPKSQQTSNPNPPKVENFNESKSDVMTLSEFMSEFLSEIHKNIMSVPEAALVMSPCLNSCPFPRSLV